LPPTIKHTSGLHVFLSDFNQICIFSTDFHKKSSISNLTEIHPVAAMLIHVDRQTDMMKATGTFRDHANAPKKLTPV
jgi:hypothetical protein